MNPFNYAILQEHILTCEKIEASLKRGLCPDSYTQECLTKEIVLLKQIADELKTCICS